MKYTAMISLEIDSEQEGREVIEEKISSLFEHGSVCESFSSAGIDASHFTVDVICTDKITDTTDSVVSFLQEMACGSKLNMNERDILFRAAEVYAALKFKK